jgi:hypothetical protein
LLEGAARPDCDGQSAQPKPSLYFVQRTRLVLMRIAVDPFLSFASMQAADAGRREWVGFRAGWRRSRS